MRGQTHSLLLITLLLAMALPTIAAAQVVPPDRGGNAATIVKDHYDYAPTIMFDQDKYRMWWCGTDPSTPGDHTYYSESLSVQGPWSTPTHVFSPTGNHSDFDGTHVCDPSIIKVNGTYYMYYGGFPVPGAPGSPTEILHPTRVGLATSPDGINWTRANNGQAIIEPVNFNPPQETYGAGQPSAFYRDGSFYLSYTDTTGSGTIGQYILRSTDPTFQSNVFELQASGWTALPPGGNPTASYSGIPHALSVDWVYVPKLDWIAVSTAQVENHVSLRFFDADTMDEIKPRIDIQGSWVEGSAIASTAKGHAFISADCATLPFDIYRPVGTSEVITWDLAHIGWDMDTNERCYDPGIFSPPLTLLLD